MKILLSTLFIIAVMTSAVAQTAAQKQQLLEDRKFFGFGDCRTRREDPRILDTPDDIKVRDIVDARIGSRIDRQRVAQGGIADNPIITAADIELHRTALALIRTWALMLPESRVRQTYLCVVQIYVRDLDEAADELVTHRLQKQVAPSKG
jgi:hypothetical protein